MKIIIYNKKNYNKKFIEDYLPELILSTFNGSLNLKKINEIDKEFDIDSISIIRFALSHLKISEQPNSYVIEIDKNKKYKRKNVESLINLIIYGNRTCRGYPLVYEIFSFVADHIDSLYKEWVDGN